MMIFFDALQRGLDRAMQISSSSRVIAKCLGWGCAVVLGTGAAIVQAAPARAANQLVITFGILGRSIPIEDFRVLADTGQVTDELRWYVNFANIDPATLQQILTEEVDLNQRLVDRITYSLPGEFLLSQIGNTVHTRSRRADIQALRAALLLSTSGDNQISLIEFLEQYPTLELYVEGRSLLTFVRDVNRIRAEIQPAVTAVETFLEPFVCDCQP